MNTHLWDRIRDWVMLVVFLATAVVVMLAQNEPLVRGLRAASLQGTVWVEDRLAFAAGYFRALEENEVLREENIQLSSEVARSRESVLENERLRRLVGFRDTTSVQLQPARIIAKDVVGQHRFITLDIGREDSVREGMAVVDQRGILGKVVLTSDEYARVMTYLNTDFRVPAKVQPLQASGIVRWEGDRGDRILLEHVVKTENVEPGQLVVTSGYSGTFPAGYPVGVVDSVAVHSGRNALDVYVSPAASLSDAEHAFVMMQLPDPERLALEEPEEE